MCQMMNSRYVTIVLHAPSSCYQSPGKALAIHNEMGGHEICLMMEEMIRSEAYDLGSASTEVQALGI